MSELNQDGNRGLSYSSDWDGLSEENVEYIKSTFGEVFPTVNELVDTLRKKDESMKTSSFHPFKDADKILKKYFGVN